MTEENVKIHPAGTCPECRSEDVARKMSFRTVLILIGLLILDYVLLASTHYSPSQPSPLASFLVIAAMALGLMVPVALLVAIFGQNTCRRCGHKWR